MKPLRICLYGWGFLPQIGGAELSLHYLAEGFQERGHLPVVLAPVTKGDIKAWEINYPVHRYYRAQSLFLLLEKLRSRFDILYVNGIYPCGYIAARLKKWLNVPIVVSCPGNDIQMIPEVGYGNRLAPGIDRKVRLAVNKVDALFAIVPTIRHILESMGVPSEKIWDVSHGSAPDRYRDASSIRTLFDIPENHRILLLLGRNHIKKAYPDFIRAMPFVVGRYSNVTAIIVGQDTDQLAPLVEELGVQKHVILSPPFTWNEYPRLLVGSDVYVSSSLGEGFSLALADAMTAGLPQVVCNVEGCRDVVRHEQTGLIVPPKDPHAMANAVVQLLTDNEKCQRLSIASKKVANEFSWDVIIDRHLSIYEQLIKEYKTH